MFKVESAVLVTQKFHLFRALFIARSQGLAAVGVPADKRIYRGRFYQALREPLARVKNVFKVVWGASPKYLGPEIPITGDGSATMDRHSLLPLSD